MQLVTKCHGHSEMLSCLLQDPIKHACVSFISSKKGSSDFGGAFSAYVLVFKNCLEPCGIIWVGAEAI